MVAVSVFGNFMVFWDPNSFVVPNRTVKVFESVAVDTLPVGFENAKVVDTLPVGFDVGTYKWDGANFVPLTQADYDAIAATNAVLAFNDRVAFTNIVRIEARKMIQDSFVERDLVVRAFMLVVLDEINIVRARLVPAQAARTKLQLRNAVQSYINDGSADVIE
jgi:hypothetical protein